MNLREFIEVCIENLLWIDKQKFREKEISVECSRQAKILELQF